MNQVEFKVMITFPHILEEKILEFNKLNKSDFKLKEVIEDEVPFCVITGTEISQTHIFNLGYGLAVKQYTLKKEGKIEW